MKHQQNIKQQHHQYKNQPQQLMTLEGSPRIKGFDFEKAQQQGFPFSYHTQRYRRTAIRQLLFHQFL